MPEVFGVLDDLIKQEKSAFMGSVWRKWKKHLKRSNIPQCSRSRSFSTSSGSARLSCSFLKQTAQGWHPGARTAGFGYADRQNEPEDAF